MEHDNADGTMPPEDSVGGYEKDSGLLFGGGVALGAALIAVVWVVVSFIRGDSDPSPSAATAHIGTPLVGSTASAAPQPSRRDRCEDALLTLSAPLRAAQPAMDQWEVHIGAMNKLVVGAISLQQATAFWNQTRVGAAHRIAEFRRSMRVMRRNGVDCPSPALLPQTAEPGLRACVHRVDADMRALRAADTAIDTWEMHVRDMERLRTGKLSPAKAGQMWVAMWQRGQHELTVYRAAARDAAKPGACDDAVAMQPSDAASPGSPAEMPGMG